jgi:hypothetical protein
MRVNTPKSIALRERIHREFGSWAEARKAAELKDGIYVLRPTRQFQKRAEGDRPSKG